MGFLGAPSPAGKIFPIRGRRSDQQQRNRRLTRPNVSSRRIFKASLAGLFWVLGSF